jgi:hypothetical protein
MNKKTILISLGVLAVAGIGYYMWKKKSETTSGEEEKSNARGNKGLKKCSCQGFSKMCSKSVLCIDCCAGSGGGAEVSNPSGNGSGLGSMNE